MAENKFQIGNGLELRVEPAFDFKWSCDKGVEKLDKVDLDCGDCFDLSLYQDNLLCLPKSDPNLHLAMRMGYASPAVIYFDKASKIIIPIIKRLAKLGPEETKKILEIQERNKLARHKINVRTLYEIYRIPDLISESELEENKAKDRIRVTNSLIGNQDYLVQLGENPYNPELIDKLWNKTCFFNADDISCAFSILFIDDRNLTRSFQKACLESYASSPHDNSAVIAASEAAILSLNQGYRARIYKISERAIRRAVKESFRESQ